MKIDSNPIAGPKKEPKNIDKNEKAKENDGTSKLKDSKQTDKSKLDEVKNSPEFDQMQKELKKESELNKAKANNEKISKALEAKKIELEANTNVSNAKMIFISGHQGIDPTEKTLEQMSKSIDKSEHFFWNQEDDIINHIKKANPSKKIILIGHGLGGDTAVEVSKKLNSIENKFQDVDLLVTLDSTGLGNDIISQNVKENINFITNQDNMFSDGPNIAKNIDQTMVLNLVKDTSDLDLENSQDLQYELFQYLKPFMN